MSPPSGRGNQVLKMVYPMAPLIMEDLNSDDFMPGGLNVYSWDKELPQNKAVLPDTGLLHPSSALEYIFIMLVFAVTIQHPLCWQSHTELFRTVKGWFGSQSKQAGSLSPFSLLFPSTGYPGADLPFFPALLVGEGRGRTETLSEVQLQSPGHLLLAPLVGMAALFRVCISPFLSKFVVLEQD